MNLFKKTASWLMVFVLSISTVLLWLIAENANPYSKEAKQVNYSSRLVTPVLSVRRIPETIQGEFADDDIESDVDNFLKSSTDTTCLILTRDGQNIVEPHNPTMALAPASNQKVVTTFVALNTFDPDYRFKTTVKADPINNGEVKDLYLIGGGDPFLTTKDWWAQYDNLDSRYHSNLEDLATSIVSSGVKKINGNIYGDESLFGPSQYGPWDKRLIDQNQSGIISALTVNENFTSWSPIYNLSTRVRAESAPINAGTKLSELLIERGVEFTGEVSAKKAPDNLEIVAELPSATLGEIITHVNSYSSNLGAEILLRHIALKTSGDSSPEQGLTYINKVLQDKNIWLKDTKFTDGSGLSGQNRLTCRTISEILTLVGRDSVLANSFSIAGGRGSLEARLHNSVAQDHVYAKTGTLNGVSALSGYVESSVESDVNLIFAYITNGPSVGFETINRQNNLVEDFSKYPEGPDIVDISPKKPIDLE